MGLAGLQRMVILIDLGADESATSLDYRSYARRAPPRLSADARRLTGTCRFAIGSPCQLSQEVAAARDQAQLLDLLRWDLLPP